MNVKRLRRSEPPASGGCTAQLSEHTAAYRKYLVDRGNAVAYVRSCEAAVAHLSMWMQRSGKPISEIGEDLVVEFVHESTNTTHRYVEANLEMKEKALARLEAPAVKPSRFQATDELMKFLQTLQLWQELASLDRTSFEGARTTSRSALSLVETYA